MATVGIIMGSQSDLPVMQEAIDILKEFGIAVLFCVLIKNFFIKYFNLILWSL